MSNDKLLGGEYKVPDPNARTDFGVPALSQDIDVSDARVAVLATRWSVSIVDALVEGALETLHEQGIGPQRIKFARVPGAFELPHAADSMIRTGRYDGLVVLGVVLRGETPHFDFVAGECARGIQDVSIRRHMPVGFGVLTVDTVAQAKARSQPGRDNKGREATEAMLDMIRFDRALRV